MRADKTTNYYQMQAKEYTSLLKKNVEKEYKKAPDDTEHSINLEAKHIANSLGITNRLDTLSQKSSFITLKDHKDNFANKPTCCLINPSKSELGRVSKSILEKINKVVVEKTGVQQWKNTRAALQWFNSIPNKNQNSFISFDIVNFYPSITPQLLKKALDFASTYINITPEERQIIMHTKQSLLFTDGTAWTKKDSDGMFDVIMGSYDGAETCELVGAYLLCQLPNEIGRNQIGLYRDDGLAAFRATARKIEQIKKSICKVFSSNHLQITIEANKKVVNFLDVTLDLNKQSYAPYIKPNNKPLYVHRESNHPPLILKNIPLAINRRLNEISSNKESFDEAAPVFQEALRNSGYEHTLKYENVKPNSESKAKNRSRNITWFHPPYSKHVATNVGKKFLSIVKDCFKQNHPLRKIFNKNTLKISYSCMPNLEAKITNHNKAILANPSRTNNDEINKCNCRNKSECPLDGHCLTNNVIYQATVVTDKSTETYIGLTETV